MNHRSTTPPAHNLTVLSADLLAVAAKRIVEQLASPNWEPLVQLKDALETYESVRLGQVLNDESEPQCVRIDEPAPVTERSVHHG